MVLLAGNIVTTSRWARAGVAGSRRVLPAYGVGRSPVGACDRGSGGFAPQKGLPTEDNGDRGAVVERPNRRWRSLDFARTLAAAGPVRESLHCQGEQQSGRDPKFEITSSVAGKGFASKDCDRLPCTKCVTIGGHPHTR